MAQWAVCVGAKLRGEGWCLGGALPVHVWRHQTACNRGPIVGAARLHRPCAPAPRPSDLNTDMATAKWAAFPAPGTAPACLAGSTCCGMVVDWALRARAVGVRLPALPQAWSPGRSSRSGTRWTRSPWRWPWRTWRASGGEAGAWRRLRGAEGDRRARCGGERPDPQSSLTVHFPSPLAATIHRPAPPRPPAHLPSVPTPRPAGAATRACPRATPSGCTWRGRCQARLSLAEAVPPPFTLWQTMRTPRTRGWTRCCCRTTWPARAHRPCWQRR